MSARLAKVTMFTDGSCLGNPGPGGWAAILRSGEAERELSGGEDNTTNNRMEMLAVINGLEALTLPARVEIYTDSIYVRDGITRWIHGWKRNNWKTSARKPVKNEDLWRTMDALMAQHDVRLHWVKGHAGHPENERADDLARAAAEAIQQQSPVCNSR